MPFHMNKIIQFTCLGVLLVAGACQERIVPETKKTPKNVLFIMVDDLRPEFAAYGQNEIISPNLDALANSGIRFDRAYCQVPICGASRASIMTGTYPTRHRFLSARTAAEDDRPGTEVLPGHFKKNGYHTKSIGKIFDRVDDHLKAWSEPPIRFQSMYRWPDYHSEENLRLDSLHTLGLPWEKLDVPDSTYFDGRIANEAIASLKDFKSTGQPFFLAVGFVKPHLPFTPPKKYWDMYDPNEIVLPEHRTFQPGNAPEEAFFKWIELLSYYGVEEGPLSDEFARNMIHGYRASVSYVDAQLGRLMEALDQEGLTENTTVVLLGDHGWHLGEHGVWCKKYSFQESLRVPLIIKDPAHSPGVSKNVVELVDLFPTLLELTNLPYPEHQLAGESLAGQLQNPEKEVYGTAFSKWQNGLTVVTPTHSYTQWMSEPNTIQAHMLYDLKNDPNEQNNIAHEKENKALVDSLESELYSLMGPEFEQPIQNTEQE